MIQIRLQVSVLLIVAALSATALGSAIKGGYEHPPTKGATVALEAPAAKGRVIERQQQLQQQQQHRIEGPIEEPLPREQLKASQEELQQVEEIRSSPSKTSPARKQPEPIKQELFKQEEQKEVLLEKNLENSKTRYEARPQIVQTTEQVREEAPAPAQAPAFLEQQRSTDYDRQEIELQQQPEQRKLSADPLPAAAAQAGTFFQQKEEADLLVQQRPDDEDRKLPEPLPAAAAAPLPVAAQGKGSRTIVQQREEFAEGSATQQRCSGLSCPGAEAEPYAFSYAVDGSSRSESGDTKGVVRGQYTLQGADGSRRIVDYIADQDGFRASVNTNEFGTETRSPAAVALRSSQPLAEDITLRLEGKTRETIQQAPIQQVYEQYRETASASASIKGAAPLLPAAPPAPIKGLLQQPLLPQPALQEQYQEPIPAAIKSTKYEAPAPVLALAPAPARKEPLREQQQQLQQPLQEPIRSLEESNKSAELRREPKAASKSAEQSRVVKELTPQSRSFESATAHREYRTVPSLVHPTGARQVVRQYHSIPVAAAPVPVAAPIRYQPPVAPVRSTLVRQYPASPVQAVGYRRYPVAAPVVVPVERRDPRVSFYSPSSTSTSENDEQPIGFDSRSS